jgi:hypothetical protein
MSAVLFLGPSLPPAVAQSIASEFELLPPAACGDLYLCARNGATHIGLIDGYFDHQPAVWHKEILWALERGVRVYGAASMGALRAAELAPFGMVGVGTIYEQFHDGVLQDDDEVALAHEPPERGYRPVSEAMVNVRATLRRAVDELALSAPAASHIEALAKAIFYPERSWGRILEVSAATHASETLRFQSWLERAGPVDQKRADALELVARMRAERTATPEHVPQFHFEHTDAWDALCRTLEARTSTLSLDAALRALALTLGELDAFVPDGDIVQRVSEAFRRNHGLLSPEHTAAWFDKAALDLEGFSTLMYEQTIVERYDAAARTLTQEQRRPLDTLRSARTVDEHVVPADKR